MALVRLRPSAAVKEKRLAALLAERAPAAAVLDGAVREAQAAGSLELAGETVALEDVRAALRGEPSSDAAAGLARALGAVEAGAPLTVGVLQAWHGALGLGAGFRTSERSREGGSRPAPPEFIAGRLAILEQWLAAESSRELKPAQAGALVMARVLEILPFERGNGRVARLAASHLVARAGGRPPILVGADAPRLEAAVGAAFQLVTEPLTTLLDEASERALDVMIGVLGGEPDAGRGY